jgi:proteic killer suppression protein
MSRNFEKQLEKIPPRVVTKVKYWIFTVRLAGLAEVRRRPGLHDEPLKGKRQGQRSVRLNRSYRLIYWMIDEQVHIELLEVHKHDY